MKLKDVTKNHDKIIQDAELIVRVQYDCVLIKIIKGVVSFYNKRDVMNIDEPTLAGQ